MGEVATGTALILRWPCHLPQVEKFPVEHFFTEAMLLNYQVSDFDDVSCDRFSFLEDALDPPE